MRCITIAMCVRGKCSCRSLGSAPNWTALDMGQEPLSLGIALSSAVALAEAELDAFDREVVVARDTIRH